MGALKILQDAQNYPQVFTWNGAIARPELENWLQTRDMNLPMDLVDCLATTGGGTLFETETLLGPYGNPDWGDGLDEVNRHYRAQGLPSHFIVFHTGLGGLSAIDQVNKNYVLLTNSDYREQQRFPSLNAWYITHLRAEYAARYGLGT